MVLQGSLGEYLAFLITILEIREMELEMDIVQANSQGLQGTDTYHPYDVAKETGAWTG